MDSNSGQTISIWMKTTEVPGKSSLSENAHDRIESIVAEEEIVALSDALTATSLFRRGAQKKCSNAK